MKKEYIHTAHFRFYEELNDFLPQKNRKKEFAYTFFDKPSVKEAVESLGVPHTEIDLILINGESVDFSHNIKEGDRISVYPRFESIDISSITRLRPKPLRKVKFVCDVHLGKLSRYLRLLGFDTLYEKKFLDADIIRLSLVEKRIILTRDLGILKHKEVQHGYFLREIDPKKQVEEVLRRFDLKKKIKPFIRCLECNDLLLPVEKAEILDKLLPETKRSFHVFLQCPGCKRVYWEGSHYDKLSSFIESLKKE